MKDATGELSMTAVAVVAIAAIAALFGTLIWPNIQRNILRSTYCSQAIYCDEDSGKGNMVKCTYCKNDDCTETGEVECQASDDIGN